MASNGTRPLGGWGLGTERFNAIVLSCRSDGAPDFNQAGAYGYEQAFQVARRLGLPRPDPAELYRRLVFNIVARNQDDHTKNISFLMDRDGTWRLAPAYV